MNGSRAASAVGKRFRKKNLLTENLRWCYTENICIHDALRFLKQRYATTKCKHARRQLAQTSCKARLRAQQQLPQQLLLSLLVSWCVRMDPTTEEEFHRNLLLGSARGHLQRANAASRTSEPAAGGDPALSNSFLLKWCYGHRAAHEINRDAINAWNAGARGGHLKQLSLLGAKGTNVKNCARDLVELVRSILGLAIVPVYIALIPLFVTKSLAEDAKPQPELCPCGFILPHIWLWFYFAHHRAQFFLRFVGCTEANASRRISDFWHNVHAGDPRRGPIFNAVNFATHCIPIGLHGDGVPCTKKDSLDVTTLFSLLGAGTTTQIICYLWSFFTKCKVGEMTLLDFPLWAAGLTLDSGAEVIIWSLQALETGLHPTHDHRGELFTTEPWISLAGKAICGGYFANLWQFRADADYQYNSLGLPGHWSSNHPLSLMQLRQSPQLADELPYIRA